MSAAIPDRIAAAFAAQGRACGAMGSPFMAEFMAQILSALPDGDLRRRILTWPGAIGPEAASVPLRLAAGFHALVLLGRIPSIFRPEQDWRPGLSQRLRETAAKEATFLNQWLDHAPQTNEVGRSAVLIAVAAAVAGQFGLPLRLSELGASAGLNLSFDRYALQAGAGTIGKTSPVMLTPEWRSSPALAADFQVADRRGCDLNPVDPAADGLRLMAYVWPDQPDRLARLRAALGLARAGQVDRADAADWLEGRLSQDWQGQCHLVYHTVAHQYFPEPVQQRIEVAMTRAGAKATTQAPLAWFGMEADGAGEGAGLALRLWPGDQRIALGRAGFHGQWIDWRGM